MMVWPRYSKVMAVEVMEMPRCFSSSIQSEVAWREARRALTSPASWMAPPYSSSFSVCGAAGGRVGHGVGSRAMGWAEATGSAGLARQKT